MAQDVRVWDPLVRIGHWTIVAAFAMAYLVEDDFLTLHVWAGYVVGGVVAVRIVWGFVGPRRARFADFVRGPRAVVGYLANLVTFTARRYVGHSPAGGAMVVVLLAMLAGTVVTGLMTYGAEEKAGPLAPLYAAEGPLAVPVPAIPLAHADEERSRSDATGSRERGGESAMREAHELFANLTLILVLLHVAGVALASIVHRENLVAAMITGCKRLDGEPDIRHRPLHRR